MKKIFFVLLSFALIAPNGVFAQKMPWQKTAKAAAPAPAKAASAEGAVDMEGLTLAIRAQDINLVKQLVTKQNVNLPDERGVFPLYVAAKEGDDVMVNLIIERGADVNHIASTKKLTALCAACARQNLPAINALLKHNADTNKCPALSYLLAGKVDADKEVELLIRHGAQVDAIGYLQATPLMLASVFGKPKSVNVLLKNKANPNKVSENLTALSAAITAIGNPKSFETVKILSENGATLSAANAARKEGEPLWQDKYKAQDFPTDKRQEAEQVITYLNELASGKPHKADVKKSAAPAKAVANKAAPAPKAAPAAKK